jgi:hypothetical protein
MILQRTKTSRLRKDLSLENVLDTTRLLTHTCRLIDGISLTLNVSTPKKFYRSIAVIYFHSRFLVKILQKVPSVKQKHTICPSLAK